MDIIDPLTTPEILNLDEISVDPSVALQIQSSIALRRQVLPIAEVENEVVVACAEPNNPASLRAVERLFDLPVRLEQADPDSLRRALRRIFGSGPKKTGGTDGDEFVRIVDEIINAATLRSASDIHIEPETNRSVARLRVDGHLEEYRTFPSSSYAGIISRIKVMASLDIAEKRLPQDGQISYNNELNPGGAPLNIRVATIPVRHGEKATLRLLGIQTEKLTLEKLGMRPEDREIFAGNLAHPHGMILLTGPTGSGKTSTFYAALRDIQGKGGQSLITIEDPVEYNLAGIPQVEVSDERLTYARALRSVLRHDPDVVMIGEIRDGETAEIAVRSAITGHLVLSTLHTNSAAGALTRLCDIGVAPFLVAATIRLVAAQRLIRVLCSKCRIPRKMTAQEAHALSCPELESRDVWDPGQCAYCAGKGYTGRIGIFELLPIDDDFVALIGQSANEFDIIQLMRKKKISTLREHGLEKILKGETTVNEVLRVAI